MPNPNYLQPLEAISADLSRAIINSRRSLDVFQVWNPYNPRNTSRASNLPTWAQDWLGAWSDPSFLDQLPVITPEQKTASPLKMIIPSDPSVLDVPGVVLATVKEVRSLWKPKSTFPDTLYEACESYYGNNKRAAEAIFDVVVGTGSWVPCRKDDEDTPLSLFSKMWTDHAQLAPARTRQIRNDFDQMDVEDPTPSSHEVLVRGQRVSLPVERILNWFQNSSLITVAGRTLYDWSLRSQATKGKWSHRLKTTLLDRLDSSESHGIFVRGTIESLQYDAPIVVTKEGMVGIAPQGTQVGDMVCSLLGFDKPIILRKHSHEDLDGRKFSVVGEAWMQFSTDDFHDFKVWDASGWTAEEGFKHPAGIVHTRLRSRGRTAGTETMFHLM